MADDQDAHKGVDSAYVDQLAAELAAMQMDLDNDPLSGGPKRLNNKIAECRRLLSRCERIFNQVSGDLRKEKRGHLAAETDLEMSTNDLLANDPEVRAGRNVAIQKATAAMKLKSQETLVARLSNGVQELESLLAVVKAKRVDLKNTQTSLRDQIRMCQEEIGLGGRWGSKKPGAPDLTPTGAGNVAEGGMGVIDELLSQVERELHVDDLDEDETDEGETDEGDDAPEETVIEDTPEPCPTKGCPAPKGHDGDCNVPEPQPEPEPEAEDLPPPRPPTDAEKAWADKAIEQFPVLGTCDVCGNTAYDTPSGSLCKEGHGGAPYTPGDGTPAPSEQTDTAALDADDKEPEAESVLPGGDDPDDFLADIPTNQPKAKPTIEPIPEKALDDLLASFEDTP